MVEGDQAVTNRHEILQLLSQMGHDQPSFLCQRCSRYEGGGSMEAIGVSVKGICDGMKGRTPLTLVSPKFRQGRRWGSETLD